MSHYVRWFGQVFSLTLAILAVCVTVWLMIRALRKRTGASLPPIALSSFLLTLALIGDVVMTLILTFFERTYTVSAIQPIPFTGLIERHYTLFFLNIAVFVPFGALLFLRWPRLRKISSCTALSAAFSLVIELLQLIFRRGVCDIDDLICNTAGGLIGALLAALLLRIPITTFRR